jgi:hypothetical protein
MTSVKADVDSDSPKTHAAPVVTPDMAEFSNFQEYIQAIAVLGRECGVVKVKKKHSPYPPQLWLLTLFPPS